MKIAWFTEGGWTGKIPRNFKGMRNDSAWMCALDATHYPINSKIYIGTIFRKNWILL